MRDEQARRRTRRVGGDREHLLQSYGASSTRPGDVRSCRADIPAGYRWGMWIAALVIPLALWAVLIIVTSGRARHVVIAVGILVIAVVLLWAYALTQLDIS